jgi:lysophospholipase L1-like esterase
MKNIITILLLGGLIGCDSTSDSNKNDLVQQSQDIEVLQVENSFLRSSSSIGQGFIISENLTADSLLDTIQPEHGVVTDIGGGKYEYLPDSDVEFDKIDFRLRNGHEVSNLASVSVKIITNPKNQLVNYGIGGYNSNNILTILPDIRETFPSLSIIMVGTNDSLNSRNPVSLDQYNKNLQYIVRAFLSGGTQVILMSIPPAIEEYVLERHSSVHFESWGGVNKKIDEYNKTIKDIVSIDGAYFVDVHGLVMDNGGVDISSDSYIINELNRSGSKDGVHLTVDGYEAIANAINLVISDNNLDISNIATIGDSITLGVFETKSYPDFLTDILGY